MTNTPSSTGYQVLARKWRPHNFSDIVGQQHVVKTLRHAIEKNRIHHAYLFTGTRGVGKTTLARIIAKCLNCEQGVTPTPCNQCSACVAISQGRFVDLIEIDAASKTKVEDTRDILDNVPYAPSEGRYKIYLIDEVHMLSNHSFNALLKTLEEPPEHVKFILATTDPQKLPVTILSRCLQFCLKHLQVEEIEAQLSHILKSEQVVFELPALTLLAGQAKGSMRDALSLLDQAVSFGAGQVLLDATRTMLGSIDPRGLDQCIRSLAALDTKTVLDTVEQLSVYGADFIQVLDGLLTRFYNIAKYQQLALKQTDALVEDFASLFSPEQVQLYYQICLIGKRDLGLAPSLKIGFEMILLRLLSFTPLKSHNISDPMSNTSATEAAQQPINKPTDHVLTQLPIEKKSQSVATLVITDWPSFIAKLTLSPPTLALARECWLISDENAMVTLGIGKAQAALNTEAKRQRLQDALSQYCGQPTGLTIKVSGQLEATPREIEDKQHEKKKQIWIEKQTAKPHVQAVIDAFDATLISDSVKLT